jgi:hypothetical protein
MFSDVRAATVVTQRCVKHAFAAIDLCFLRGLCRGVNLKTAGVTDRVLYGRL